MLFHSSDHDGTFTATSMTNATASFLFNGTGLLVNGSASHGSFRVIMDGSIVFNGSSAGILGGLGNAQIFDSGFLSPGFHNATFINPAADPNITTLGMDAVSASAFEMCVYNYDNRSSGMQVSDNSTSQAIRRE